MNEDTQVEGPPFDADARSVSELVASRSEEMVDIEVRAGIGAELGAGQRRLLAEFMDVQRRLARDEGG